MPLKREKRENRKGKCTSLLELPAAGVRLPRENPASIDLVLSDV